MSNYTSINSQTTTTLLQANSGNTNNATSRRTSNVVRLSKVSITNNSTQNATVKVFITGSNNRTVNQSNSTTNKIIFDEENYVSITNRIDVGDSVFDSDGFVHGTITALNPDTNNTKEITISASVAITNNEVFKIGPLDHYITGNIVIPAGVVLVLDDPFDFNILKYKLKITSIGALPSLTVRID